MDGIADDGGELDPTNISREARVRAAYLEWCKENGKETDESRFPTFSSNFLAMEAYANDNDKTMQLNKYADFSEEEYAALTSGKSVETEIEVVAEAEEEAAETKKAAEAKKAEVEAEKAAAQAAIKKAAGGEPKKTTTKETTTKTEAELNAESDARIRQGQVDRIRNDAYEALDNYGGDKVKAMMDQMEKNHCMCWKFPGLRELVDYKET